MSLKNDKVNATTDIAGITIEDRVLADWLFGAVKFCTEVRAGHQQEIERINEKIRQILIVHYCLLGADQETAEAAANDYIKFITAID